MRRQMRSGLQRNSPAIRQMPPVLNRWCRCRGHPSIEHAQGPARRNIPERLDGFRAFSHCHIRVFADLKPFFCGKKKSLRYCQCET
jgi:hypothetical protein